MNGIVPDGIDERRQFRTDRPGIQRGLHPRVRPLLRARPFADQRRMRLRPLRHRQARRIAHHVPVPDGQPAGLRCPSTTSAGSRSSIPASGGGGFAATHGTVAGIVYFSDGESHVQFVNVIARKVDAPGGATKASRRPRAVSPATGSASSTATRSTSRTPRRSARSAAESRGTSASTKSPCRRATTGSRSRPSTRRSSAARASAARPSSRCPGRRRRRSRSPSPRAPPSLATT